MSQQTSTEKDPVLQEKARTVQLYTWYAQPKTGRTFGVIEKIGKGVGFDYRTVAIRLIEHLNPTTVRIELDEFFDLVDKGSLVEQIPT